jgi:hypothetical protein
MFAAVTSGPVLDTEGERDHQEQDDEDTDDGEDLHPERRALRRLGLFGRLGDGALVYET